MSDANRLTTAKTKSPCAFRNVIATKDLRSINIAGGCAKGAAVWKSNPPHCCPWHDSSMSNPACSRVEIIGALICCSVRPDFGILNICRCNPPDTIRVGTPLDIDQTPTGMTKSVFARDRVSVCTAPSRMGKLSDVWACADGVINAITPKDHKNLAMLRVIFCIRSHIDRTGNAIGHVEKARNIGNVPN